MMFSHSMYAKDNAIGYKYVSMTCYHIITETAINNDRKKKKKKLRFYSIYLKDHENALIYYLDTQIIACNNNVLVVNLFLESKHTFNQKIDVFG